MAIYLSFLVPKITAIVHATPTNARPTPSAWNHEHNRVSDFVPIASLLEWQWGRIVMRNGHPATKSYLYLNKILLKILLRLLVPFSYFTTQITHCRSKILLRSYIKILFHEIRFLCKILVRSYFGNE